MDIKIKKEKVAVVDIGNLYDEFVRKEYAGWDYNVELDFYESLSQLDESLSSSVKEDYYETYQQLRDLFIKEKVDRIVLA